MPEYMAGGVLLPDGPYMIGAGVCKTPASANRWLQVAPVVSGSYTILERAGSPGKVMWPATLEEFLAAGFGLNSYSMPNMGVEAAMRQCVSMVTEQPLIINLAGFSVADYIVGVQIVSALKNVKAVELNFGCPNTQGEHSDIISFTPRVVENVISSLLANELTQKPLWLKFSPYSNPAELKRMALLINQYVPDFNSVGLQVAVVTCNTFPNAYAGEGKIDPNDGMAGLSGPALKPIALGQVRQFRQHLDDSIDVFGVGGITTGNDIVDFLDAGAAAVEIVSLAHWAGDPETCFTHLTNEKTSDRFLELMNT